MMLLLFSFFPFYECQLLNEIINENSRKIKFVAYVTKLIGEKLFYVFGMQHPVLCNSLNRRLE